MISKFTLYINVYLIIHKDINDLKFLKIIIIIIFIFFSYDSGSCHFTLNTNYLIY